MGDAVIGTENAGWTPIHARTAHDACLQKKTGPGSWLNQPSRPSNDPLGQGTEVN